MNTTAKRRHHCRTGRILALITALITSVLISPPALADGGFGCTLSDGRAACVIVAEDGTTSTGTNTSAGTTASQMTCTYAGREIPCTSGNGSWSAARGCYIEVIEDHPADDPAWSSYMEGHDGGVIMSCTTAGAQAKMTFFWAESAPEAGPDPAVVAQQAIQSMNLHMGTLASNPPESADPSIMGLVGYPVWLWISDPSESTTGPITRSATAGSVTVTATATLSSIRWSMGDGTTVTCLGAGTPWSSAAGAAESPTCGHTYQQTSAEQPNLQYPVTATATWDIQWTGGGQSGSQTLTFSDSTNLRIGEAQVLLTGSGS
ncbi:MAG: hypothetical protein Q4D96_10005 [Propionibacteriaceae bacterium]|nr:hypothetical protein [Propionibacteriaceae bacterium]